MGQASFIAASSAPPAPPRDDINERYFADRLAIELRLAETAHSAAERAVHLGACRYLCALLGVPAKSVLERPSQG